MGGAHQVVVHRMGKVIGGDAVCFQQHDVVVVFREFDLAFDQVFVFDPVFQIPSLRKRST